MGITVRGNSKLVSSLSGFRIIFITAESVTDRIIIDRAGHRCRVLRCRGPNRNVFIVCFNSHVLRGNFQSIGVFSRQVALKCGFDFYRDRTDIRDGRLISGPSFPIIRTVLNRSASEGRGHSTAMRTAIIRAGISGSGDGQFLVIGRNFQRTGLVGDGIVFCQRVVFQRMARNRIRAGTNFRLAALYGHARKAFFAYEAAITDRVAVSRQRIAVILLGIGVRRQFDRNGRDRQRTCFRGDVVVASLCIVLQLIVCNFIVAGASVRLAARYGHALKALIANESTGVDRIAILHQFSAIILSGIGVCL